MHRYSVRVVLLTVCGIVAAVPASVSGQVPLNGGFETGAEAPQWTTITNYPGYTPFVFTGAPLESYPDLTPYAGTYSMMFYRDDTWHGEHFHPWPEWYECGYTRQSYRIAPGSYTFSVGAAGFVHHDRYEPVDEDPWGAGVALNIYVDVDDPELEDPVFSHDWWPSESGGTVNVDGEWKYYNPAPNYKLPPGSRDTTTIEVFEEVEVIVEIVWLSKWDTDLDAVAIDAITIDGLPPLVAPAPSPKITAIESMPGNALRITFQETGDPASSYALEKAAEPGAAAPWATDPDAVIYELGAGLFEADTLAGSADAQYYRGAATP